MASVRFDFIANALLQSCCDFFLVFVCKVYFLVGYSFFWMVVPQ